MSDSAELGAGDGEGSVRLVGTAHVSADSVDEVREVVDAERPDVVAVELDEGRYRQMQGEVADDLEPADLLEGNTVFQFLAYWMLSYVQARMGEQFDIEPGADMQAAIEAAEGVGSEVALVDRDIQTTIQRFWARMTLPEKLRMVGSLALGVTDPVTIGVAGGAVVGTMLALLFGVFVAPTIGLGGVLTFGAGAVALQTVGGLVGGALVGGAVGALFLAGVVTPRIDLAAGGGLAVGALAGVAVGLRGGLAPVVDAATLAALGDLVLRSLVAVAGGIGVGAALGFLVGLGIDAVTADEDELDEEFDIAELTDGDVVSAMMEEFRQFSPGGAEALIDERDAFIAHRLVALRKAGHDVVAVVGAGHRAGIESYLEAPETLPPMESLVGTESGSRFSLFKIFGYLIAVAFLAFFFLLFMAGVQNAFLLEVFAAWFLFNGVFAFGLAKLAGAHWTSAGVGGAVAWLTSVNPLLAPGWFAGYVELKYSSVNVGDIAELNQILSDEESPIPDLLARMLDVPLFRLIAIVAMTNVGSMVASFAFPFVVLPLLGSQIGGVNAIGDLMIEGARNSADLIANALT
ncbi:TraB/GumN family protein [Halorussus halobius]|uniref:TraB/GumN family protein n=1 Tax=Halorussus halobius TaxID=1710537 RepID=UPI00109207A6|nr:TraB/GumN family protein [Halorussus halobius]